MIQFLNYFLIPLGHPMWVQCGSNVSEARSGFPKGWAFRTRSWKSQERLSLFVCPFRPQGKPQDRPKGGPFLKRRFAPKKRRFAPAFLGPKGSPREALLGPKFKKNMKNGKPSKTVREKRYWGSKWRNLLRMSVRTILNHHFFEKTYFFRGSRPLR